MENTNQLIASVDWTVKPAMPESQRSQMTTLCSVHNCVREKGLDTCVDCVQMLRKKRIFFTPKPLVSVLVTVSFSVAALFFYSHHQIIKVIV